MPACRYFLCAIGLLSGHHDILEHCRTVGRFRHYRELKTTLGTRFRKHLLLLMQIVGLVGDVGAARADTNQPGILQLKVRDDIFPDGAATHGPGFGLPGSLFNWLRT